MRATHTLYSSENKNAMFCNYNNFALNDMTSLLHMHILSILLTDLEVIIVLYYSATGNTKYIAQEIAKRLDDECINLLDLWNSFCRST